MFKFLVLLRRLVFIRSFLFKTRNIPQIKQAIYREPLIGFPVLIMTITPKMNF